VTAIRPAACSSPLAYKLDLTLGKRAEQPIRDQSHHDQHSRLLEEVKSRQRNTVWPDTMVNGVRVDALLWKGSPKATKVQRIGMAIWGLTFSALGIFFTFVQAPELHSPLLAVMGLFVLALGARVTFNAFRRKPKSGSVKER
jgi:hypothetical protein